MQPAAKQPICMARNKTRAILKCNNCLKDNIVVIKTHWTIIKTEKVYGGVPTNVGSGGGFQPLAIISSDMLVRDAIDHINTTISTMNAGDLLQVVEEQREMAMECDFTYLLGPVKIALRPRVVTARQIEALKNYGRKVWADSLTLENMWQSGKLDDVIHIEEEELEIARMHPWRGSAAIIASDGLFGFGAEPIGNDPN